MANRKSLTGMATLVMVSLLLAGCNFGATSSWPPPTPAAHLHFNTPTPYPTFPSPPTFPPTSDARQIISRALAVISNHSIKSYIVSDQEYGTFLVENGEVQRSRKIWYQEPYRWRIETTGPQLKPDGFSMSGKQYEDTVTEVTDSVNRWYYSAVNNNVGIKLLLDTPDLYSRLPDLGPLTGELGIVGTGKDCTIPTLLPNEQIAGRSAYHLALTAPYGCTLWEYESDKGELWIDQQTYVLLKAKFYFKNNIKPPAVPYEATSAEFNVPIDLTNFTFTLPANAHVNDSRSRALNMAEVRQKVGYSVYVPTYVPAGLIAESIMSTNNLERDASVAVIYHNTNGKRMLTVVSSKGKAGFSAPFLDHNNVVLHSGATAYVTVLPPNCNYGSDESDDVEVSWQQAGLDLLVYGSLTSDAGVQLTRDDFIKVANSLSDTAELSDAEILPTVTPAPEHYFPTPQPTLQSCPVRLYPPDPSSVPELPLAQQTNVP